MINNTNMYDQEYINLRKIFHFKILKFVLTGINKGIRVYYLLLVHVNGSTYYQMRT